MPNFATGFAQGFIRARERTEDRQAEQENLMFKYQMDNLMQTKELRTKKKLQESEWANQAKDLSSQMGDTNASATFYNELKNGVSYENLQKRIAEGQYVKNDNYKQPVQNIKVPEAVSGPLTANPTVTPTSSPAVKSGGLFGGLFPSKEERQARMQGKVDEKIDSIDPTLRQVAQEEDPGTTYTTSDEANTPYIFKDNKSMKLENYDDLQYQLLKAKEENDPTKVRDVSLKIKAHEIAISQKAKLEAAAKGENTKTYFIKDEKGVVRTVAEGALRVGPDGEQKLYNVVTDEPIQGEVVPMSDEDIKRWYHIVDNVGKKTADYNDAMSYFVAASDTSLQIEQVLNQNPAAATAAGRLANIYTSLREDLAATWQTIEGKDKDLRARVQSGDMDGIEKEIKELEREVFTFIGADPSTAGIDRLSLDAAKLRSLKTLAAYQYAAAIGVSSGKLSNQDFENNFNAIGADRPAPEMLANLRQVQRTSLTRLDVARSGIENDSALKDFKLMRGFETEFTPKRAYDYIEDMSISPEEKAALKAYIGGGNAVNKQAEAIASESAKQSEQSDTPQINSKEDYDKLPSGTTYIAPDGKLRRKP